MTTFIERDLPPGARIEGKWNGGRYRVVRKLGAGANGAVYLVERDERAYALKIGFDPLDLQSEINAIAALPMKRKLLIDADDCRVEGRSYAFYVTPYAEGSTLRVFMRSHGEEWLAVIVGRLLRLLGEFHRSGLIFGDLKPENILVTDYGQVALVDYGGVTRLGQSVRQYTELYDRGYWRAGSRTADAQYDLFSLAALLVLLRQDERGALFDEPAERRSVRRLLAVAQETAWGRQALPFLRKALSGHYAGAQDALADWRELLPRVAGSDRRTPKAAGLMETAFVGSLVLCACAIYLLVR